MAAAALERRVVFYGWEDIDDRAEFDRLAAAKEIRALDDVVWRYEEDDGFTTGAVIDQPGTATTPTRLRFFRLRSGDDLPHVLDARHEASPLRLRQNEAVTDWTHVVIWPDGFAAHDYRRDAPALGRLQNYFRERADQYTRFFPLYDRSLISELEQLESITALDIKFQLARSEQIAQADNLGMLGGLVDVGQAAEAATVETRISVGRSRTHHLSQLLKRDVHTLAERAEGLLDNLVIAGERDGRRVKIDVLRKRLSDEVRVRRSRSLGNAPDPGPMYDAILASRRRLDEDERLTRAVRI